MRRALHNQLARAERERQSLLAQLAQSDVAQQEQRHPRQRGEQQDDRPQDQLVEVEVEPGMFLSLVEADS